MTTIFLESQVARKKLVLRSSSAHWSLYLWQVLFSSWWVTAGLSFQPSPENSLFHYFWVQQPHGFCFSLKEEAFSSQERIKDISTKKCWVSSNDKLDFFLLFSCEVSFFHVLPTNFFSFFFIYCFPWRSSISLPPFPSPFPPPFFDCCCLKKAVFCAIFSQRLQVSVCLLLLYYYYFLSCCLFVSFCVLLSHPLW